MRQKLDTNDCMRGASLTVHTYPARDTLIGQLTIHFDATINLRSESRNCLPRPHVDPNLAWKQTMQLQIDRMRKVSRAIAYIPLSS